MWQPPACYEGCRTPNLTPPAETSSTAPHGLQLAPVTPPWGWSVTELGWCREAGVEGCVVMGTPSSLSPC